MPRIRDRKMFTATINPGLVLIERYAAAIIAAGEERIASAFPRLSEAEAARQRAQVATLSATIAERLLAEHRQRTRT